jgi:hypothetical protein
VDVLGEDDLGAPGEREETGAGQLDGLDGLDDEAEPGDPAGPDNAPGARVYVLREPPV